MLFPAVTALQTPLECATVFRALINFGIQEPEWNWSCPKFRKGFTTNGLGFWTTSTKRSHSFHIWRAVSRGLIIKCYLWVSPCKEISGHFFSTLFFVFTLLFGILFLMSLYQLYTQKGIKAIFINAIKDFYSCCCLPTHSGGVRSRPTSQPERDAFLSSVLSSPLQEPAC